MELITTAIVGKFLWENLGQSILDSAKEKFGDMAIEKLDDALDKLPFKKNELEVIEAEIVEADREIFKDEKSLIAFLEQNQKIKEVLNQLNKRETNINIKVEKGVGYIGIVNGDINI